jgi:hypothetical protein
MAWEKRPGQGSLFKNDKKQQETHADMKGDALVHCPNCAKDFEAWLSAWWREGRGGDFLNMSIKPKEERSSPQTPKPSPPPPRTPPPPRLTPQQDQPANDDIPF